MKETKIQKDIRDINKLNKQTKYYIGRANQNARDANILSIVAIILSIAALIIRLLIIKG